MNTLKLLHDPEALKQAAKAGATWRDLAAIIGVSERTLRRWRSELEDAEHYSDELLKAMKSPTSKPVPKDGSQYLCYHPRRPCRRPSGNPGLDPQPGQPTKLPLDPT